MYFDEMKLGMSVEVAPAVIYKDKMLAFAKEYDDLPMHTDEEYAKTTPFGKLIAPGVMSFMAVWAKYLEVVFLVMNCLQVNQPKLNGTSPFSQKMC